MKKRKQSRVEPQRKNEAETAEVPVVTADASEAPVARQETPTPEAARPWSVWTVVRMVLAAKVVIFIFGGTIYRLHANEYIKGFYGWLYIWNKWDGARHLRLAESGYTNVGEFRGDLVGFPLLPWLVRYLGYIFQDPQLTAILIVGVASCFAAVFLYKLSELDERESVAKKTVWFMLIFPTSYFLHINYNESLFLAFTLGAFWFARKNNWAAAGALAILTCMTRLNGLVIVPALALEAYQQYRQTRKVQWQWGFILLAPLGFGVYLLVNKVVTDNWFEFLVIGRDHFRKTFSGPWTGIWGTYKAMYIGQPNYALMTGDQEFVFVLLSLVLTVLTAIFLRPAYTVWMAGNWLLFASVGFILSAPRYTLVMFPMFILFAKLSDRRPSWYVAISVWSLLMLSMYIGQFVRGHWAF